MYLNLKGAIFDADGTLLDSMGIWRELGARYLASLNIEPEENLGLKLHLMSLEQSSHYLKEHYNLEDSEGEILSGILDIISEFYREEVKLKPGVREFLAALSDKGVPMVIATSGSRELLSSALERNGIAEYFDEIFTCSELNTTKHEPEIFLACAEFLGLEPESIGVFEDSLFAIETAKKAGFITFGVEDESNAVDVESMKLVCDFYVRFRNLFSQEPESY